MIGLLERGQQTTPGLSILVDLTPPEIVGARLLARLIRQIVLGLALLLLLALAVSLHQVAARGQAQSENEETRAQTTALQQQADSYADITTMQEQITRVDGLLDSAFSNEVDFVALSRAIRGVAPAGTTIDSLPITLVGEAAVADPTATEDPATDGTSTDDTVADSTTAAAPAMIGTVAISGTAPSIDAVSAYVVNLSAVTGITAVVPNSSATTADGVTYSISFQLTDELYLDRTAEASDDSTDSTDPGGTP